MAKSAERTAVLVKGLLVRQDPDCGWWNVSKWTWDDQRGAQVFAMGMGGASKASAVREARAWVACWQQSTGQRVPVLVEE